MSKRANKKEHILWTGLETLRAQGYNGTGVKDIVDAAGVPKGSFYNYFDSKEAFAIEALDAASVKTLASYRDVLASPGKTPLEQLYLFFEFYADQACKDEFRVGCFFGNMCQEMSDSSDAIRVKVSQVLKQITALFENQLELAKATNEIDQSVNSHTTAEFMVNAWEGTLMRIKATQTREPLDAFLQLLPRIIR
ncbi:MAG: TetR/AcrR family transcriptional regulator [Pseudomonadota bacterium]